MESILAALCVAAPSAPAASGHRIPRGLPPGASMSPPGPRRPTPRPRRAPSQRG
eukprot:CAMPEP_0179280290 /NCGR_PEP_ID=MMETSP0797-20121207/36552_1 /TAXON_ID=47934 /ORGANISM="Dinophysis acuminata, Strain DAEP01" /LENGTH=53 /DNA_ID=CAMNT_0020988943 /DNA_START=408 /DNA_END=565 /DNA_ORIENTATION=+